jgi:hypothetical protein
MLVQRWGILQMAMPKGLSIPKIIALVNTLAKLHNFCIDENDGTKIPEQLNIDNLHMMNDSNGYVPLEVNADHGTLVSSALMDGCHHFADIPRHIRRQHD